MYTEALETFLVQVYIYYEVQLNLIEQNYVLL